MKVFHIANGLVLSSGAIASHVSGLSAALRNIGVESFVVAADELASHPDCFARSSDGGDVILHVHTIENLPASDEYRRVFTNHSWRFVNDVNRGRTEGWRSFLATQQFVIATSEEIANKTWELGVPRERIANIPNGVDVARFAHDPRKRRHWRQRLEIGQAARVLFCPKPWVPNAGVIDFAHSLRFMDTEFAESRGRVVVLMAGRDDPVGDKYVKAINRALNESALAQSAIRLGEVAHDEMPGLLSAVDVCVLPSLEDSTSIVALESMAAGVPVVASRVGGLVEIIAHGQDGLLVERQNPVALAATLTRVLRDDQLRQSLGTAAIESAQRFSWDFIASRTKDIYTCLLTKGRN